MGMNQPDEKKFRVDVVNHAMTVIRDDGIDRHLRFRRPGTIVNGFDLITWPGYLCICGDMGTYVFSRLADMFEFFRSDSAQLRINHGYWAEKVQAMDRNCGIEQYSPDVFRARVKQWLDDCEVTPAVRRAVKNEVLNHADDGEWWARQAVDQFEHEGFRFTDFWEARLTEYTYQYVWCLYAIVWGIQRYDEAKKAQAA